MERLVLWHRILPPTFGQEENTSVAGQWARDVTVQINQSGGQVVSSLAGTVVSAFEPSALELALHLALRLLSEAEDRSQPAGGLQIAFGVALGEVREVVDDQGRVRHTGSAIDRAQSLANQAQAGEVVLDVESREAAGATFLFGRSVGAGSVALQGEAIDRARPLLAECREAQSHLHPAPLPASLASALDPVQRAAQIPQSRVFLLDGPPGLGVRDALVELCQALKPPAFFEIDAVPGALEPLGGLRLALLRAWRTPERVRQALEGIDPNTGDALEAIACGNPPPRHEALNALRVMLRVLQNSHGVAWFYIERPATVDLATFSLLEQLLHDPEVALLLFWRARGTNVPTWLRGSPSVYQIHLPMLGDGEAAAIAAGMMRNILDPELPRQIAALNPTTRLEVVETVRALIASGDVVHDGTGFGWRVAPRSGGVVNTRALLEERLSALDDESIRYLELACAALPASTVGVVDAAAAADSLDPSSLPHLLQALSTEGLLDARAKPTSEILRRSVTQQMVSSRRATVYRLVANALREAEPFAGPCMEATIGAYLCESGNVADGVDAILDAGRAAASCGYERAANRLAAAAVQYQPDDDTRQTAAMISRRARDSYAPPPEVESAPKAMPGPPQPQSAPHELPPAPKVPSLAPPMPAAASEVLHALNMRDFARVERLIDAAIAGGGNLATARCFRAIANIGQGEFLGAQRELERARSVSRDGDGDAIRIALTAAWLHWTRHRYDDALIECLEALARARRTGDAAAEAAALHMLAVGCEATGRAQEAARLTDAARSRLVG